MLPAPAELRGPQNHKEGDRRGGGAVGEGAGVVPNSTALGSPPLPTPPPPIRTQTPQQPCRRFYSHRQEAAPSSDMGSFLGGAHNPGGGRGAFRTPPPFSSRPCCHLGFWGSGVADSGCQQGVLLPQRPAVAEDAIEAGGGLGAHLPLDLKGRGIQKVRGGWERSWGEGVHEIEGHRQNLGGRSPQRVWGHVGRRFGVGGRERDVQKHRWEKSPKSTLGRGGGSSNLPPSQSGFCPVPPLPIFPDPPTCSSRSRISLWMVPVSSMVWMSWAQFWGGGTHTNIGVNSPLPIFILP